MQTVTAESNLSKPITNVNSSTKEQAIKKRINEIIFTIAVVLLVGISLQLTINYFYINDLGATIAGKETTLEGIKTENNRLINIQSNYSQLLVNSAKAENDYRNLQSLIPQRAELPKLLDWASEQARARGLVLESFEKNTLQQNTQQKAGQLEQVSVKVVVTGDQFQIAKLLVDFARHERILLVESVNIGEKEKNKELTEIKTHKAEIIFSAFVGTDNGKLKAK